MINKIYRPAGGAEGQKIYWTENSELNKITKTVKPEKIQFPTKNCVLIEICQGIEGIISPFIVLWFLTVQTKVCEQRNR